MNSRFIICLFVLLFSGAFFLVPAQQDAPVKLSLCELKKDPAAYHQKLIEITAFVSHGFEDFTLFDPACPTWPDVWLQYGERSPLVIEKIRVELVADERFAEFLKLIQRPPDSVVRATLVGRFFAKKQTEQRRGGGYGHMGCCSLLAIQQVVAVERQDSTELDYRAWAEQPDIEKKGCGYTELTDLLPYEASLKAQARADSGEQGWAFTDPKRVAAEGLEKLLLIDQSSIALQQTQKMQGRFIYRWRPRGKKVSYMVVVSKPYWLSFYTKDPKRVAWVLLAAYESSCGGPNSVQRIQ